MSPPLTIVTGFLGSGKTTLLRRVIDAGAGGRRLGLIVNEIGAAGFDGAALGRAGGPPLVELTDGCICCAAGSDFLLAVEELIAAAAPDQIVIETTGLAEPGGMIRQARAAGLRLDSVVAVAAAAGLEEALAASPVAAWQLQAADLIVLSKLDLASPAERAAAEARLAELSPRAPLVAASAGSLAAGLLFEPRGRPDDPQPQPEHLAGDGFSSMVWEGDAPLRRAALEATLARLGPAVFRAKGLVHCSDGPWPDELHLVGTRHSLRATRLRAPVRPLNRLVLIGPGLGDAAGALRAALDACAEPDRARAERWWAGQRELYEG